MSTRPSTAQDASSSGAPSSGAPSSDPAALARLGLTRVGGRPPLGRYLLDVWRRRTFVVSLARYRIEAENGRNRLGMAWVVLKPLINAGIYGAVLGLLLATNRDVDDFVPFLVIGVFLFEYFSTSFQTGSRAITANAALVQSLAFPRLALPLAAVVQRLLQLAPMLLIMGVVAVAWGNPPDVGWLLVVPLVALFTCFNLGVTLVMARLTVHFRDLTQLLPFVSRLFFYTSGIFYSIEQRFADGSTVRALADWQPIHVFLTLGRAILLDGPDYTMPWHYWGHAAVWSLGALVVGVVFFWSAEERYGRVD